MNKAQFYQGLVAALVASRKTQGTPTTGADKRLMDMVSESCSPLTGTRTKARFALLEIFANLAADQQERYLPLAVACASMIDGYVNEFDFRKMLKGWTEPESAEFRKRVLARLNLGVDGREEPT